MYRVGQSTTATPLYFMLVLSSDHLSPATGKTPTVTICKNGGAFGSPSGAVTELANGWYKVAGNATDSATLGPLLLHATEASSDNTDTWYEVVAQDLTTAVIATVTTVTNQLTAAAIATGVWQDATGGDFTTASSIGKALYVSNVVPGAAGGHFIAGTNAATTITSAGGDALTLSSTGSNGRGLAVSGNGSGVGAAITGGGTGAGLVLTGGATSGDGLQAVAATSGHGITATGVGTTKHGINATGGATTSDGIRATGGGAGAGLNAVAGGTGPGVKIAGGGTSGDGIDITTTSGDGVSILPTAGNGIVSTANGTSKHGAVITGGTAGTSDGIKAVAGTGGVDIRGAITGNVTGNLSGSVGSVTGAVGSVTGAVGSVTGAVGSVTGAVGSVTGAVGSVTGSVGSVTGAVGSVTGNVGGNVVGSVASVTAAVTVTGDLSATMKTSVENATWDATLASHLGVGSTGSALNAAGSSGDPWNTALPGAYGAGSAGNIVGNNLDAKVSTRLATSGYTAPLDAPGTRSAVGLASANLDTQLAGVPDALLDEAAGVETNRTMRQALRLMLSALVGKVSGAATNAPVFRDTNDTKNRITAATDASGDRTSVTYDAS